MGACDCQVSQYGLFWNTVHLAAAGRAGKQLRHRSAVLIEWDCRKIGI
jgi:hypothetical protein